MRREKDNRPLDERFWSRVDIEEDSDCLVWIGLRSPRGYGIITRNRGEIRAHRFAWEFAYGPIPHGMLVCHRCDNPPCVKAEHLFLGTNLENVRDMMEKGRDWYSVDPSRALKGEEVASSTLTAGEVRQMAEFRKAGIGMRELARIYGVNHGTISRICAGKSWSHVVVAPIECQGLIEARRMWELHATGLSHREISIELGRDKSYVWRVLAGKRWPEAQPVR